MYTNRVIASKQVKKNTKIILKYSTIQYQINLHYSSNTLTLRTSYFIAHRKYQINT